jgi:hypothetical protein
MILYEGDTFTKDGKEYIISCIDASGYKFEVRAEPNVKWWFDPRQEEECRVMCCATKPDTNYVEITPEYAEYLRNKPVERCVIKIPEQGDTYLALSGGWNTKPTNAKFGENEKEPYRWCKIEKIAGWRVYDVVAQNGSYIVKDYRGTKNGMALGKASGRVGFGGVQFEGQNNSIWHMITSMFISPRGYMTSHACSGNGDDKPAVPIRARFREAQ